MSELIAVDGAMLGKVYFRQLNEASLREFGVPLPAQSLLADRTYFLLLEGDNLLASGFLKRVEPVFFAKQSYSLLNIGGIIANIKGKGFGTQVVLAIRSHLTEARSTGVGFCFPGARPFYEKCGLNVDTISTPRFVYLKGKERVTEQEGQYVIYQDGEDRFMAKVLANPKIEVFVPTPTMW